MNWGPCLVGLWPGLARLWIRGEWSALLLAVGFSALLNVAIVSTFVWPEWIGAGFNSVVWPVLGIVWLAGCWSTWQQRDELFLARAKTPAVAGQIDNASYDRLYIEAQSEYLKGRAESAQRLLERQLQRFPRDAASRLLLATLFRRTDRPEAAGMQLDQLEKYDQSLAWRFEIGRERELIAEAEREAAAAAPGSDGDPRAFSGDVVQDLRLGENAGGAWTRAA